MGRLTHEAYDSPASGADYAHTYAFDDAGNRESWLKDTDPAFGSTGTGHLTFDVQSFAAEVTVTYDYDANDRLLTETLDAPGAADDRHTVYDWDNGDSTMQLGKVVYDTLDDTGDVVREESFTYSARGRMAGAEIDADGAGPSSAAETTTEYSYDDSGFRIRQSTMHDSTTVVTEFVADASNATGYTQTIEEHSREGTTATRQVSYTIGLDEIVQAVKDNPAASAVVSQFLHDGRGSVRQLADAVAELVQAATKDAASVLKLDYSAYGTAVNYAAETVATALLHNGEFVDPVTGQQYLRARWYDQATGRFNRIDPFAGEASVPQSLHKYLFAHGDPATGSDPKGEAVHWVITTLLAGAVLGVTFAVAENIAGGTLQQQWSAGLAGLGAGVALGATSGAPGLDARKVLVSAGINGLAFALAYIAAEQIIKQSQASAAEIVLQFANGVSEGALSEAVDQINIFREGSREQQLLQTLYAPLYNAFSSISASLHAKEPIDWQKLQTRFMVDVISAYFSQSEFSRTWFTKVGVKYTGADERVVVTALTAFFKDPELVATAVSSFVAAFVGQFV